MEKLVSLTKYQKNLTTLPEQNLVLTDFGIEITKAAIDTLFEASKEENKVHIRIGVKGGGCIHSEQEIGMYDGTYKVAKDIVVGDEIISCNGEKTVVKLIHNMENKKYDLLSIAGTINKSHSILLTPKHKIYIENKGFINAEDIMASEISPQYRDFLYFSYPSIVADKDLSEDICKIFGYYLAEGCISYRFNKTRTKIKSKRVEFACGKHEKRLILHIQRLLHSLNIKSTLREKKTSLYLTSYNTNFANLIEENCGNNTELFGKKRTKLLHKDLILLPLKKQIQILKYYRAGDGSKRRNKSNNLEIRSSSTLYQMSRQIEMMVCRTGFLPSFQISKKSKNCTIEGRVCNQSESYEISHLLTASIRKYKKKIDHFSVKVGKKELVEYSGPLIDFTCSPHEAYSAGGYLIHNCSGFQYTLECIDESSIDKEEDLVVGSNGRGVMLVMDIFSREYLKGTVIDYVKSLNENGFKFLNPQAKRNCGCR